VYKRQTLNMDIGEQRAWFSQYSQVRHAIITLETTTLRDINTEFERKANQLADAIDRCESALHGLRDAKEIMAAVSGALGSIASLVAMFA
jgi:hypothetical protein